MAEACEEGSLYLFLYKMRGNFLSSSKILSSKILSSSRNTLLPGVTKLVKPFLSLS